MIRRRRTSARVSGSRRSLPVFRCFAAAALIACASVSLGAARGDRVVRASSFRVVGGDGLTRSDWFASEDKDLIQFWMGNAGADRGHEARVMATVDPRIAGFFLNSPQHAPELQIHAFRDAPRTGTLFQHYDERDELAALIGWKLSKRGSVLLIPNPGGTGEILLGFEQGAPVRKLPEAR